MFDEFFLSETAPHSDYLHRTAQTIFFRTLSTHLPIKRSERAFRAFRAFVRVLQIEHMYNGWLDYPLEYERHIMVNGFSWDMINCRLSTADEIALTEFIAQERKLKVDPLLAIIGFGYKVSVSWIDNSNSFVVSASGPKDDHPNARKTLSSWSDDYVEALWMTLYKISVVFEKGPWKDRGSQNWG